jgi:hypothetical protein
MADLAELLTRKEANALELLDAAAGDFHRLVERYAGDGSKLGTLRGVAYLFASDVATLTKLWGPRPAVTVELCCADVPAEWAASIDPDFAKETDHDPRP